MRRRTSAGSFARTFAAGQSISRSDRNDLNDKDMLKPMILERFLIDQMNSSGRKAL